MAHPSRWLACAFAFAGAACKDDSSFLFTIDAGAVDRRYASVCTVFAQTLCARAFGCALEPPSGWASQEQCVERETLACELTSADPSVHFDADAVAHCVADDGGCASALPNLASCLAPGDTPNGGVCLWAAACASRQCFTALPAPVTNTPSACGRCADCSGCLSGRCRENARDGAIGCTTFAGLGELCDTGGLLGCQWPDMWCDSTWHCARGATLGEPCAPSGGLTADTRRTTPPCAEGYCDPTLHCSPMATIGQPCGDGGSGPPCAPANRVRFAYCDESQHCAPIAAAAYGARCGPGAHAVCSGGGSCIPSDTNPDYATFVGTCSTPLLDGLTPCVTSAACLPPATCVRARCVYPTIAVCAE
jgi:hypothetical protein